jgi:hypothetical protein
MYIVNGTLENTKVNNNNYKFYIDISSRVIYVWNNNVSSLPPQAIEVAIALNKDMNKKPGNVIAQITSKESNSQYVAHVSKFKAVKINDKTVLKMTASVDKLHPVGKYATESTNLDDIRDEYVTMTIKDDDYVFEPFNLTQNWLNSVQITSGLRCVDASIDWRPLPDIVNRGPTWYILSRFTPPDVNVVFAAPYCTLRGSCDCSRARNPGAGNPNIQYIMHRNNGRQIIVFRRSRDELRGILTNSVNFNPPFTESEFDEWFRVWGRFRLFQSW